MVGRPPSCTDDLPIRGAVPSRSRGCGGGLALGLVVAEASGRVVVAGFFFGFFGGGFDGLGDAAVDIFAEEFGVLVDAIEVDAGSDESPIACGCTVFDDLPDEPPVAQCVDAGPVGRFVGLGADVGESFP